MRWVLERGQAQEAGDGRRWLDGAIFTVCEALTNVAKYANATHAWITVERRNGHLAIEVGDDGVGGVDLQAGSGLEGLRDRIAAVDGTLETTSAPDEGTVLRALVPV